MSLLLALNLVYPTYLFNMGPAYMFSGGVETLRIDGYLTLVLLTHGELVSFHRLMKYGEPLSMGKTHSSKTHAAGLKTLLVEYLLMQNRHMTGEEKNPKTREEWREANSGIPLLTDLCLSMRSDPVGVIRGVDEVMSDLHLRTSGDIRLSGPSSGRIPPFSSARELNKRVGWDGAELVSTRGAQGTDE